MEYQQKSIVTSNSQHFSEAVCWDPWTGNGLPEDVPQSLVFNSALMIDDLPVSGERRPPRTTWKAPQVMDTPTSQPPTGVSQQL